MESTRRPWWLAAAPAIFLFLWALGFSVAKVGLEHADPLTLLALRYGLVLAVLAPLFLVLRPPLPRRGIDWVHIAAVGFLIHVGYFSLCYLAMRFGLSAGGIALVVALQPLLVGLLAPHLVGETVGGRQWIGLCLGLAGAALVIASRMDLDAGSLLSLACAFAALFSMVAATLYEKRFGAGHHPVASNLLQYAVGLAGTLPLALAFEEMRVEWNGELMAVLAYLVIGNSLVAITLLLAMIRAGEASRVSALFYLVPPLSALLAWLLIGEQMGPLAWLGMALAAGGVSLAGRVGARVRRI